eukprot:Rmarinus@m.23819
MLSAEEISILVSSATVSSAHTLLPNHWISFSLIGKAQKWSLSRTLFVTVLGALGHVVTTFSIGLFISYMGSSLVDEENYEKLGPLFLIFIGAVYVLLFLRGVKHSHAHAHPSGGTAEASHFYMAAMAIALPTLSPCAAIIPIFLMTDVHRTSLTFYVSFFFVLLCTTMSVMVVMVGLSLVGAQRLSFSILDRYEKLIVGSLLLTLGVFSLYFHHDHGEHGHDHAHHHAFHPGEA